MLLLIISFLELSVGIRQNRESTEGYSKSIVGIRDFIKRLSKIYSIFSSIVEFIKSYYQIQALLSRSDVSPLTSRSKTRRRATIMLPTWIYSCQSIVTINFTLPFTTSVTILISILQTFRSWAATSHLRSPMAFLSHNSSDTPGLAPLMNVLFWGRCDFPISFTGRDM